MILLVFSFLAPIIVLTSNVVALIEPVYDNVSQALTKWPGLMHNIARSNVCLDSMYGEDRWMNHGLPSTTYHASGKAKSEREKWEWCFSRDNHLLTPNNNAVGPSSNAKRVQPGVWKYEEGKEGRGEKEKERTGMVNVGNDSGWYDMRKY